MPVQLESVSDLQVEIDGRLVNAAVRVPKRNGRCHSETSARIGRSRLPDCYPDSCAIRSAQWRHFQVVTTDGVVLGARELDRPDWASAA